MAEVPAIQVFSGDGRDECSTLIHNVRSAAYREGKIRDPAWMADFASIHFMGEALAWYARLPRDVQEDWPKLQAALANRWSTPECEYRCASCARSPGPGPQNAAASEDTAASDGESGSFALGRLKAVENGSGKTFYVKGGQNVSIFDLTQDVQQAARFRFEARSTSPLLEFVNARRYSWLAVNWRSSNPTIGRGSTQWGSFSAVDQETMKDSYNSSCLFRVVKFRFLSSGGVVPVQKDGNTEMDLTGFTNGGGPFLASDPEAYGRYNSSERRLTFYIEKIDE